MRTLKDEKEIINIIHIVLAGELCYQLVIGPSF